MVNGVLLYEDAFAEDTQEIVSDMIAGHSPTFIFCDNGNKARELKEYALLLKTGDLIACHDYRGICGRYEVGDEQVRFLDGGPYKQIKPLLYRHQFGLPIWQRL